MRWWAANNDINNRHRRRARRMGRRRRGFTFNGQVARLHAYLPFHGVFGPMQVVAEKLHMIEPSLVYI